MAWMRPNNIHRSVLQIAVHEGDLEIFNLLLSRGANVNASSTEGRSSPLGIAASGGRITILKELLEHGAEAAFDGSSALVASARTGNGEAVALLLDNGADLHCQDGVPGKALHVAAYNGCISTCKLLLDRGLDVNAFGGRHG